MGVCVLNKLSAVEKYVIDSYEFITVLWADEVSERDASVAYTNVFNYIYIGTH